MKFFSALAFLLIPMSSFAITFELIGPCSPSPVLQTQASQTSRSETLGHMTIEILTQNHISFDGSESGMRSILNTPTGDDALEVLSDKEMRAYGWCVDIDGQQPGVMPDRVTLSGSEHIRWFYAFSHYVAGKWVSMCEPAYEVKPAPLCSSHP